MRIYNYNNEERAIDLKEIPEAISVTIVSGDEIVTVKFKDGTSETYDAAFLTNSPRTMQFYDGCYVVTGKEKIKEWLNYRPVDGITASYMRAELFGG